MHRVFLSAKLTRLTVVKVSYGGQYNRVWVAYIHPRSVHSTLLTLTLLWAAERGASASRPVPSRQVYHLYFLTRSPSPILFYSNPLSVYSSLLLLMYCCLLYYIVWLVLRFRIYRNSLVLNILATCLLSGFNLRNRRLFVNIFLITF